MFFCNNEKLNTIQFYAEKCLLDNNKGYYCIIRAMKEIFPIMETIYSTYDFKSNKNIWTKLSAKKNPS